MPQLLVSVKLAVLAKRLSGMYAKPFDELMAAAWLSWCHPKEVSQHGSDIYVFVFSIDPSLILESEEIRATARG